MLGFLLFGRDTETTARHTSASMLEAARDNGGSLYLDTLPGPDYGIAEGIVSLGKADIVQAGDGDWLVLKASSR